MITEIILEMIMNQGNSVDSYFLAISLVDRYLTHIAITGIGNIPDVIVMAASSVLLASKLDSVRADFTQTMKTLKASERHAVITLEKQII